jgi:hypothetical protein
MVTREDSALAAIRRAARGDSRVVPTVTYLADVVGPRLMGTPAYYQAATWAAATLRGWGADAVVLESFDGAPPRTPSGGPGDVRSRGAGGYRGWEATGYDVSLLVGPAALPLLAHPQAYTAPTAGPVVGEAVLVRSDSAAHALVARRPGALRGAVLLLGERYRPEHRAHAQEAAPARRRHTADELRRAAENMDPNDVLLGHYSRRSTREVLAGHEARKARAGGVPRLLSGPGVLALLEPSDAPDGVLHADGNGQVPAYARQGDPTPIASFVLADEHFGRLVRMIERGSAPAPRDTWRPASTPSRATNRTCSRSGAAATPSSGTSGDARARPPRQLARGHGRGGHAAGVAVMMEAARLLRASGCGGAARFGLRALGGR